MKWGIRRYQNEDGSLTPEWERRYYQDDKGKFVKRTAKELAQYDKKQFEKQVEEADDYSLSNSESGKELRSVVDKYRKESEEATKKYWNADNKYKILDEIADRAGEEIAPALGKCVEERIQKIKNKGMNAKDDDIKEALWCFETTNGQAADVFYELADGIRVADSDTFMEWYASILNCKS